MTNGGDITWEEMWAEEERQRQAAVDAAWRSAALRPESHAPRSIPPERGLLPPTLAPEPYFGEPMPHHPEPQPYFEVNGEPAVGSEEDLVAPPPLRVTLPAVPSAPKWRDPGDEVIEGLDEIDWQAPPATASEPAPSQRDREWESTWADGIHRRRPKHAK